MAGEASKYPVDQSKPLCPTKCLYLQDQPSPEPSFVDISTSPVFSAVTRNADGRGDANSTNSPHVPAELQTTARRAAASSSAPTTTTLRLRPKSPGQTSGFLSRNRTHLVATGPDDTGNTPLAELTSGGLWSLGQWTLTFPADSPHSSHEIKLRPVGVGARADWFVKDSVPYFWDLVHVGAAGRHAVYKLFKAVEGKRVEVARFEALKARDRCGILWVDAEGGVDEVVACVTLVATINRVASFRA